MPYSCGVVDVMEAVVVDCVVELSLIWNSIGFKVVVTVGGETTVEGFTILIAKVSVLPLVVGIVALLEISVMASGLCVVEIMVSLVVLEINAGVVGIVAFVAAVEVDTVGNVVDSAVTVASLVGSV
jgi:hypothetical protein